jgi:hypothetical protein
MNILCLASAGYNLWPCDATTSGIGGYGTIEIEYGWQLTAIPITYGFWDSVEHKHVHDDTTIAKFKNYVLDQITDLYGPGIIEVANTYPGDLQAFYSYVVGSTPESSPHNWQLVYDDNVNKEISGFWIKSLSISPITISWGEAN